jgi:hypothetical protein
VAFSINFLDKLLVAYGKIRIVNSQDSKNYMTTVTQAEIEQYRSQLAEYPDALKALDLLEKCEGDLEYAAETVAIESGESDDNNSGLS